MRFILNPLLRIVDLLYPQLCLACQQQAPSPNRSLCLRCEYNITPTNFHELLENPVTERFWGRVDLQHASTSFSFSKGGLLQQLIHKLKYDNKPQIGVELGKMYGNIIKNTPPYDTIDYIIPVPIHPKKLHSRGYNQAAMFAQGLSLTMEKPWSEQYLLKTEHTASQTKKSREDRFANVQNTFGIVQPEALQGKHLLLVDDVITTGATLEACAKQLLEIEGVKVSLAAIALAS